MSRQTAGFLIVFREDIDDETAAEIASLLRWIEGVADVQPVVHNTDQLLAQIRIDTEWRGSLIDFLRAKDRTA